MATFQAKIKGKVISINQGHTVINIDAVYISGQLHAPTILLPHRRGLDAICDSTSLREMQVLRSQLVRVSTWK
jgi:hypothetical protein